MTKLAMRGTLSLTSTPHERNKIVKAVLDGGRAGVLCRRVRHQRSVADELLTLRLANVAAGSHRHAEDAGRLAKYERQPLAQRLWMRTSTQSATIPQWS
ncbi:hypothetical protein JQ544_16535 [Bradyrhizobium diazoefficiens]|nr:hypothetical protein [Bradyrhizobium diazoefficiens]MBR0813143.1 hypothetical protein [Bradyrhizobium diazoefficiens]